MDTNSAKAKIAAISSELGNQKIAILGLGGTGSYILDLVAKTPVCEIHLFDGDRFLQHNAFRSPGAPSLEELRQVSAKVTYLGDIYAKMRGHIFPHDYYIDASNIDELSEMDFVFLSLDKGGAKKLVVDYLSARGTSFIDVGMGVLLVDESLLGHVRVTTSTADKRDHVRGRVSFSEGGGANDYSPNPFPQYWWKGSHRRRTGSPPSPRIGRRGSGEG